MHNLAKPFIFILSLLATGFVNAASFEDGVPQTLVEQFTQGRVSPDLPVDFPPLDLPDSLTVMGSLDNNFNQVVILESTQPAEQATAALVASLFDAGWMQLTSLNYEQPQNGFVSPTPVELPIGPGEQYCHDRYGTLSISPGTGQSSTSLLNVRLSNMALMQPGFSCRQQDEQRQMQLSRGAGFPFGMGNRQYMPRLVLPEGDTRTRRVPAIAMMGGFSGSNDDFETSSAVSVDWSPDVLNEHFARQLEEQGWVLDADWAGDLSAGGNWTFSPEPNLSYIGILTILKRNNEIYDLKFRMLTRNSAGAIGVTDRVFVNEVQTVRPAR